MNLVCLTIPAQYLIDIVSLAECFWRGLKAVISCSLPRKTHLLISHSEEDYINLRIESGEQTAFQAHSYEDPLTHK